MKTDDGWEGGEKNDHPAMAKTGGTECQGEIHER